MVIIISWLHNNLKSKLFPKRMIEIYHPTFMYTLESYEWIMVRVLKIINELVGYLTKKINVGFDFP